MLIATMESMPMDISKSSLKPVCVFHLDHLLGSPGKYFIPCCKFSKTPQREVRARNAKPFPERVQQESHIELQR